MISWLKSRQNDSLVSQEKGVKRKGVMRIRVERMRVKRKRVKRKRSQGSIEIYRVYSRTNSINLLVAVVDSAFVGVQV